MASALIENFKREFSPVPLLQSGHLPIAKRIPHPENLDIEEMERLRQMGRTLIHAFPNFIAVAYTQFPNKAFAFFDADAKHNNAIFLSDLNDEPYATPTVDHTSLADSLLINPTLQISKTDPQSMFIEGCGSIENANLNMFVKRPRYLTLRTHVYNPELGFQTPTPLRISCRDEAAAICKHETDHLKGRDSTNARDVQLFNPWQGTSPIYRGYSRRELVSLAERQHAVAHKDFLVRRDNELIVVNPEGEYIRKFTR